MNKVTQDNVTFVLYASEIIKAQLMLSLSNNQALGDKIGEVVAKDVTHNTQVTTNNSGLIKYSCGYKELKDFTFDFEAGVDKKTMRPSIATTIHK